MFFADGFLGLLSYCLGVVRVYLIGLVVATFSVFFFSLRILLFFYRTLYITLPRSWQKGVPDDFLSLWKLTLLLMCLGMDCKAFAWIFFEDFCVIAVVFLPFYWVCLDFCKVLNIPGFDKDRLVANWRLIGDNEVPMNLLSLKILISCYSIATGSSVCCMGINLSRYSWILPSSSWRYLCFKSSVLPNVTGSFGTSRLKGAHEIFAVSARGSNPPTLNSKLCLLGILLSSFHLTLWRDQLSA